MRKCKVHVLGVVFANVHEPSQQAWGPLANTVFCFLSRGRKVHSLLITVRNERRVSNYCYDAFRDTSMGNIIAKEIPLFVQVNGTIIIQ